MRKVKWVLLGLLAFLVLAVLVGLTAGKAFKAHLDPPEHLVRPVSEAQQERRERLAQSEPKVIQVRPDRWGRRDRQETPDP